MTETDGPSDGDDADREPADDVDSGEATRSIKPFPDALGPEELRYPEFRFDEGHIDDDGGFDLERSLDREAMAAWLRDLAGGLASHDVAVEAPNGHVTFGVGASSVGMSFEPDENHTGTLEVTVELPAKAVRVADGDAPKLGARGGRGFIPLAMLTDDEEKQYRCYNWIEDPTDP